MKNTCFFAVLLAVVSAGAYGAGNCIAMSGDALGNVRSTKEVFMVGNKGYVCDKKINDNECTYDSVILYGSKLVYCEDQSGYTDTWVPLTTVFECQNADYTLFANGDKDRFRVGKYLLRKDFKSENGAYVCKKKNCTKFICKGESAKLDCLEAKKKDAKVMWSGDLCYCTEDGNKNEYVWDKNNKKCVPSNSGGGNANSKCELQIGSERGSFAKVGATYSGKCTTTYNVHDPLDSTEHLKANADCNFYCKSAGWNVTLKDNSCADSYKPDGKRKKCISKQSNTSGGGSGSGSGGGSGGTNQQRSNCEKSGGTWSGGKCECSANKGLTKSGSVCTCLGGYEWNADKRQGCKKTDATKLRELCAREPNATWNDVLGQCVCDKNSMTPNTHEFNVTAGKCQEKAWYADCKVLIAQGKARITKQQTCECTQSGYVYQDGKCVETAEAAAQRIKITAKKRVDTAYAALKVIHDKFRGDVSVWKDEEGNFNTARLASDSIAAVVLGTAGGLITSNVVKKNQVESGFEDIKCTIGGQNVAQWGDQFRVGIQ